MTDYTVNPADENPDPNSYVDEHSFRTASFIQDDLLLSLINFCLVLFTPVLVWEEIDHKLMFAWQGFMITLLAARWFCRFAFANNAEEKSSKGAWSNLITFLILLEGIGWGIAGALLFPINSVLMMSAVALLLIGVAGVGAASYSAKIFIAISYLACVTLPYITRLYFIGGDNAFLIADTLGLLSVMFYFSTIRSNSALNTALDIDSEDEKIIFELEEQNILLEKTIRKEKNKSKNLTDKLKESTQNSEGFNEVITQYSEELYRLAGTSINLINDLELLKQTELTEKQQGLLADIEENANHLSNKLNNPEAEKKSNNLLLPQIEQSSNTDLNNIYILIVNDNNEETDLIEACAKNVGLDYLSVRNVQEALAILCEAASINKHFDFIITNSWMSNMDGLAFAECLQEDTEFKDIEFIMIDSEKNSDKERLNYLNIDLIIEKPLIKEDIINAFSLAMKNKPQLLPASIKSLVDDSAEVFSTNKQPPVYSSVIDQYVIDGLRSLTAINFNEIVHNFLEEAPQLLEKSKQEYKEKKYSDLINTLEEFGSRSLHMGAIGLMETAKMIEKSINNNKTESITGMLQSINAEFIQVESSLLAELSDKSLFSKEYKN